MAKTYEQIETDLIAKFSGLYKTHELHEIHRFWRSIGKRVMNGSRIPDQRLERKKRAK